MPTKKVPSKSKKVVKKTASAARASKKAPAKKAVSKKAPAKKKTTAASTKKKTVTQKTAKRKAPNLKEKVLVCADAANCFWTNDGQVLRDLDELQTALSAMANDVFNHHVTKEKNDFADWVEHVLRDAACAAALRKSKKPNTARTVVVRHLKLYSM